MRNYRRLSGWKSFWSFAAISKAFRIPPLSRSLLASGDTHTMTSLYLQPSLTVPTFTVSSHGSLKSSSSDASSELFAILSHRSNPTLATLGHSVTGCVNARSQDSGSHTSPEVSRRALLSCVLAFPVVEGVVNNNSALAAASEYRNHVDRLDGYAFSYPAGWIQVRGAGADVFYRDPVNLDENLLVSISSPSSSKFKGVDDLGTPQQAARNVLQQYLTEFMSTRIGVRREANIVSTNSRIGNDGRLYYEVEVMVSSYANNNQLAVMPESRVAKLEWSRRYLSVLGVENSRLYELRLQVPERMLELEKNELRHIMNSFQVEKLEV